MVISVYSLPRTYSCADSIFCEDVSPHLYSPASLKLSPVILRLATSMMPYFVGLLMLVSVELLPYPLIVAMVSGNVLPTAEKKLKGCV